MTENLKFEQHAVISFFTKYGKNATEIENELRIVYGDFTSAYSTVAEWTAKFKLGRGNLEDDPVVNIHHQLTTK